MANGVITRLNWSNGTGNRFGFVSCPGKADLRFEEADVENGQIAVGTPVEYDEMGDRAKHVRVLVDE